MRRLTSLVFAAVALAAFQASAEEISSCSSTPSDTTGALVSTLASVASTAPDCTNVAAPALPAWLPPTFSIDGAVTGVKAIESAQGHDPAAGTAPTHFVFSDIDQTLLKTVQPVLLRNAAGSLLHDPDGNLIMIPDKDFVGALNKLKAQFPTLDWASYSPDFSEFNSIDGILATPEIKTMVDTLKKAKKDPSTRVALVTARSGDNTSDAMTEYFKRRGLTTDGIMAVNNGKQNAATGMTDPALKSAMKKALAIAANIKAADPTGTSIKDVTYYDDGDENLIASMQLLPAMFPNIQFKFVDIIHTGHRHFVKKDAAVTGPCSGALISTGDKHALTPDEIKGYKSTDIEWPPRAGDGDLQAPQS